MAAETTAAPSPTNAQLIRRLFLLAWRYRARCVQVLSIQLVLLTIGLTSLSLTGVAIDYLGGVLASRNGAPPPTHLSAGRISFHIPADSQPVHVMLWIAVAILGLSLIRGFLNYFYSVLINLFVQQELVVSLRGEIYEKLQQLSFRFFDANSTGSIITRVTGDVQSVRMFVDQVMIQSVIMVISLVVYLIYMGSLHVGLTLACLATTPLLWFITASFSRQIQPAYAENRTLVEKMVQTLAESIQGIQVTKAFGREAEERAKFDRSNQAVYDQQRSIFWKVSLFSPTVGFLTRVNMMVLLGYGGWLVMQGQLPLGTGLVVFAGLLEQFSGQVNQVATIANSIQQSLIGARRVFEVIDAPIDVRSGPEALHAPKLLGEIRFDHVSFGFEAKGEPVVKDINLEIKPGQCVAILGATGAGKSALMSLVPRFFDPTSGRVLIDGRDVRELRLDDLRRNIGIVFQESFLFSNTIAANIAFGYPNASPAQIEKAARIAAAHDFIMAMPQGYDTILGESGSSLSGGQRQRLAIARAVLLEPSILLLDDPTAAIDSRTEHEIFEALENAISGRTTLIVAHRLSTLRRADFVIVMENGRIIQSGTHEELMSVPGPYLRVADLQLVDRRDLQALSRTGGRT